MLLVRETYQGRHHVTIPAVNLIVNLMLHHYVKTLPVLVVDSDSATATREDRRVGTADLVGSSTNFLFFGTAFDVGSVRGERRMIDDLRLVIHD